MELHLIMPNKSDECVQTQKIWQTLCQEQGIRLNILMAHQSDAQALIKELGLVVFPALLKSRQVLAIGHPTQQQARLILQTLTES